MPIQSLSDSDIRAIGSSLVLNDARSVVKELIDNALDAHANTISIEISGDTVGVIQVKDNGSGIGGEDRRWLCKRGCTSKISTIQDLENLGGSFLGFRGEALASVAGLSHAVLVTTRIDGELVGSTSKFGQNGQLLSSSSASHPVGTTVRIQDFLKTIPVRRQTALKAASRTLSDIKKILQAYAFAHPNVRMSFKVLRGKNDKYNWTYGPTPGSTTLLSATAKIIGQEIIVQCEARHWKSDAEEEAGKFHVINAVVAKGEGDPNKLGSKGHFISIDGRPMSTTRGVFKDFVKLYKTYYRHWMSVKNSADCSVDPFLCLHLQCPAGSYDVNIEPAKDEVLFTDVRYVRNLLEGFLKDTYGDLPEKSDNLGSRNDRLTLSTSKNEPFELLLAKRERPANERAKNSSRSEEGAGVVRRIDGNHRTESDLESRTSAADGLLGPGRDGNNHLAFGNLPVSSAKPHRNMYDFDEDDLVTMEPHLFPEQSPTAEADDDAELRKASVTNPWSIAKLNAPVLSTTSPSLKMSSGDRNEQLMTPGPDPRLISLVSTTHRKSLVPGNNLLSPARSEASHSPPVCQNPGPPLRRKVPVYQCEEDDIESTQDLANEDPTHRHPTSLELWAKPKAHKTQLPSCDRPSKKIDIDNRFNPHHDQDYENSEEVQTEIQSTQLTGPVEGLGSTVQSRNAFRKSFISPLKTPERPPALHPPQRLTPTTSPGSKHQSPTRQPWGWSQDDRRSTSPASQAYPLPLSQSHQHPMASPPVLPPLPHQLSKSPRLTGHMPHPDLDEIMDFELRKKAVNAQRRSQLKLTNRYLNPGQLAQMQRESAASLPASERGLSSSSPFRKHPAPSLKVGDDTVKSYNPGQVTADNSSQRQSPHQNRYQAARAALTPFKPPTPSSHAPPPGGHEIGPENPNSTETLPRLPEDDPRAYLIQHRSTSRSYTNGQIPESMPGFTTRTGLKFKRTKISKLPFETIPPNSAIHNISARPLARFPPVQDLTASLNEPGRVDTYTKTGRNHFMVWDANSSDVPVWESRIVELVGEKYAARLGGGDDGEEIPANLQVGLGVVLRAHCEGFA